jgi:hypothetical protein
MRWGNRPEDDREADVGDWRCGRLRQLRLGRVD